MLVTWMILLFILNYLLYQNRKIIKWKKLSSSLLFLVSFCLLLRNLLIYHCFLCGLLRRQSNLCQRKCCIFYSKHGTSKPVSYCEPFIEWAPLVLILLLFQGGVHCLLLSFHPLWRRRITVQLINPRPNRTPSSWSIRCFLDTMKEGTYIYAVTDGCGYSVASSHLRCLHIVALAWHVANAILHNPSSLPIGLIPSSYSIHRTSNAMLEKGHWLKWHRRGSHIVGCLSIFIGMIRRGTALASWSSILLFIYSSSAPLALLRSSAGRVLYEASCETN